MDFYNSSKALQKPMNRQGIAFHQRQSLTVTSKAVPSGAHVHTGCEWTQLFSYTKFIY